MTYCDNTDQAFYIWGEVVNDSGDDQRIITLWPMVQDAEGNPINSKDEVDAIGKGYKNLRKGISLPPGLKFPFSFRVDPMTADGCTQDRYVMMIETEPDEPTRNDLSISRHDLILSEWPAGFSVEGSFENPGPDLSESVAIVVTLYDQKRHVIGVGWLYEKDQEFLSTGTHDFRVEAEMWPVADQLELTIDTLQANIWGH